MKRHWMSGTGVVIVALLGFSASLAEAKPATCRMSSPSETPAVAAMDVTEGWEQLPIAMPTGLTEIPEPPEVNGAWKKGVALKGIVPATRGGGSFIPEEIYKEPCNAWYRRMLTIPVKWKGSLVTFEQELQGLDMVVFVNGQRVGTLYSPFGWVDLTPAIEFGKPNEIRLFATNRGVGTGSTSRYRGRDDFCSQKHFCSAAVIRNRTPAFVDDVFVDTSVRQSNATIRCQIVAQEAMNVELVTTIFADNTGKPVKTAKDRYPLTAGLNKVEVVVPWKDPVCWEPSRPYLYRCELAMKMKHTPCEVPPPILFGFREVWRDKGQIMLNGHPLSVRGFWSAGIRNPGENWENFRAAGFNAIYETHQHESRFRMDQRRMEKLARNGMLMFIGAPSIASCGDAATNPQKAPQYRRYLDYWARSVKNWPSVIAASVGVNMVCAAPSVMNPNHMGVGGKGNGNILAACRLVKEYHPNCLAFAHGDGNLCDIGCCNFYFNFTPLQERLEWYSNWYERRDRADTIPFYPCEYGQPYYGAWFGGGVPTMAEWCAAYFGEEAFRTEDVDMLVRSREITYSKWGNWFGGWAKGPDGKRIPLQAFNRAGDDLHIKLVQEVDRAWRAWHCRILPMYLDDVDFSPKAANTPEAIAHRKYKHEMCVFLAGRPNAKNRGFCDQLHAFWSGGEIVKSVVAIWDGLGTEQVGVSWTLKDERGKLLDKGSQTLVLKPNDVRWEPIKIRLPQVKAKTKCRLEATFSSDKLPRDERTDVLELEVYPPFESFAGMEKIALFDPFLRETADTFRGLGLEFRSVKTLSELAAAPERLLVIGRRALEGNWQGLTQLERRVREGAHLLIMDQGGNGWRKLGFDPEDMAPRIGWNFGLEGVEPDELRYWGGSPLPVKDTASWNFGPNWGHSQDWHHGKRGWRWTHSHAISLSTLRIPTRTLFRPLVRNELDLAYASLLRADVGKGSVLLCALAFDYRVGPMADAAATKVLKAMLEEFARDARVPPTRRLLVSGREAERLANALGFPAIQATPRTIGKDVILLVGNDTPLTAEGLRKASSKGIKVFAVGANKIAEDLGFKLRSDPKFCRAFDSPAKFAAFPFEGVGLSMLRWRESPRPDLLAPRAGWTVAGGGAFGISADGNLLLDQVPPFRVYDERRLGGKDNQGDEYGLYNCAISLDDTLRRYSLVLLNWGVEPPQGLVSRLFSGTGDSLYFPSAAAKYDAYGYVYW